MRSRRSFRSVPDFRALALLVMGLLSCSGALAASLAGSVELLDADGERIDDASELLATVVYFTPNDPALRAVSPGQALLTTERRQFVPRVLVIETGTTVRFPNSDPILHNVFSSSPGNRFDLGLYGRSDGETHRFDTPGLVRVFCNVHSSMSAHIVVVDTPHHLRPDGNGRFRFDDLPSGPGRLTVWHERSEPLLLDIDLDQASVELEPIQLQLTVRQIEPQRQRLRRRGRY
ncbi:cupredoxin domain-containing protein [Wenzhouxiangella marina]|uniref:Uncharacterized protein n=1 Tax=Wenzhouxiangella marina TaxID=1579979 RepID=A0A0K0XY31_9GAMM|nr:hypothetical protein [Wenzhouxiangella marina]AKS42580.1 hypothetical protein WM2015_2217 [Wenzhouxiangella marina]MBB6085638.1 plastocyanin [Wenzhouxiangella marina]